MWPYVWIVAMVGLVVATLVAAMREKSARAKVAKEFAPQPLDDGLAAAPAGDGFGDAADPLFDTNQSGEPL